MSRNSVARVDFYFEDWLTGTFEMPCDLRGAYITVCSLIWKTGNRLEDRDEVLARWCAMSIRKWKTVKSELVAAGKITVEDGFIRQKRAENELQSAVERVELAREKGAKGGKKKAENQAKRLKNNETPPASAKAEGLATITTSYKDSSLRSESPPVSPPVNGEATHKHDPAQLELEQAIANAAQQRPQRAEPPPEPKPKRKREPVNPTTALPSDWTPTEDDLQFARKMRLNDEEIELQSGQFRDWWAPCDKRNSLKSDWSAAWRTWVRNYVVKYRNGSSPRSGGGGSGGYERSRNHRPAGVSGAAAAVYQKKYMEGHLH